MEVNGQRLQESMGEEINWVHKGTPLFPYTPQLSTTVSFVDSAHVLLGDIDSSEI